MFRMQFHLMCNANDVSIYWTMYDYCTRCLNQFVLSHFFFFSRFLSLRPSHSFTQKATHSITKIPKGFGRLAFAFQSNQSALIVRNFSLRYHCRKMWLTHLLAFAQKFSIEFVDMERVRTFYISCATEWMLSYNSQLFGGLTGEMPFSRFSLRFERTRDDPIMQSNHRSSYRNEAMIQTSVSVWKLLSAVRCSTILSDTCMWLWVSVWLYARKAYIFWPIAFLTSSAINFVCEATRRYIRFVWLRFLFFFFRPFQLVQNAIVPTFLFLSSLHLV